MGSAVAPAPSPTGRAPRGCGDGVDARGRLVRAGGGESCRSSDLAAYHPPGRRSVDADRRVALPGCTDGRKGCAAALAQIPRRLTRNCGTRAWGLGTRFKRRQCCDPVNRNLENRVVCWQLPVPSPQSRNWSVARVRACPVCESEMVAKFASECEPPVAWSCPECGLFQLESGGAAVTGEEHPGSQTHPSRGKAERRQTPAGPGPP